MGRGRGRGGLELTFGGCEALGGLLGRLHAALDELTAPVQQSMLVPTPRAADASAAVAEMLRDVPGDGDGTDFDALTARYCASAATCSPNSPGTSRPTSRSARSGT